MNLDEALTAIELDPVNLFTACVPSELRAFGSLSLCNGFLLRIWRAELYLRAALNHLAAQEPDHMPGNMLDSEIVCCVAKALDGTNRYSAPSMDVDFDTGYLVKRINHFLDADGAFPLVNVEHKEAVLVPFNLRDSWSGFKDLGGDVKATIGNQILLFFGQSERNGVQLQCALLGQQVDGTSYDLAIVLAWLLKNSALRRNRPAWRYAATGECGTNEFTAEDLEIKLAAVGACSVIALPSIPDGSCDKKCISVGDYSPEPREFLSTLELALVGKDLLRPRPDPPGEEFVRDVLPVTVSLRDPSPEDEEGPNENLSIPEMLGLFRKHRVIVVSGNSGSGKSTLLESCNRLLHQRPIASAEDRRFTLVPCLIKARGFTRTILSEIKLQFGSLHDRAWAQILVIVDGLDAGVGLNEVETLRNEIASLLQQPNGLRFLLSTRYPEELINGTPGLPEVETTHVTLEKLGEPEIDRELESLGVLAQERAALANLCRTPFYLGIVRSLWQTGEQGEEPESRMAYHLLDRFFQPRGGSNAPSERPAFLQWGKDIQAIQELEEAAVQAVTAEFSIGIMNHPSDSLCEYADDIELKGKRIIEWFAQDGRSSYRFRHELFRDHLWVRFHAKQPSDTDGMSALAAVIEEKVINPLRLLIRPEGLSQPESEREFLSPRIQALVAPWKEILAFAVQVEPSILDLAVPSLLKGDLEFAARLLALDPSPEERQPLRNQFITRCINAICSDRLPFLRQTALEGLFTIGEHGQIKAIYDGEYSMEVRDAVTRRKLLATSAAQGAWPLVYAFVRDSILGRAASEQASEEDFARAGKGNAEILFRHLLILCHRKQVLQDARRERRRDIYEKSTEYVQWMDRTCDLLHGLKSHRICKLTAELQASVPLLTILAADFVYQMQTHEEDHRDPVFRWDLLESVLPPALWISLLQSFRLLPIGVRPRLDFAPFCELITAALDYAEGFDAKVLVRTVFHYRLNTEQYDSPLKLWDWDFSGYLKRHEKEWQDTTAWILARVPDLVALNFHDFEEIRNRIKELTNMGCSSQEAQFLRYSLKRARFPAESDHIIKYFGICILGNLEQLSHKGENTSFKEKTLPLREWLAGRLQAESPTPSPSSIFISGKYDNRRELIPPALTALKRLFMVRPNKQLMRWLPDLRLAAGNCHDTLSYDLRKFGRLESQAEKVVCIGVENVFNQIQSLLQGWSARNWEGGSTDKHQKCVDILGRATVILGKYYLGKGNVMQHLALRTLVQNARDSLFARFSRTMLEDVMVHMNMMEKGAFQEVGFPDESKRRPALRFGIWATVFAKEQSMRRTASYEHDRRRYLEKVWEIFAEERNQIGEQDLDPERRLPLEIWLRIPECEERIAREWDLDDETVLPYYKWKNLVRKLYTYVTRLKACGRHELTIRLLNKYQVPNTSEALFKELIDEGWFADSLLYLVSQSDAAERSTLVNELSISLGKVFQNRNSKIPAAIAVFKAIFERLVIPSGIDTTREWLVDYQKEISSFAALSGELATVCAKVARLLHGDDKRAWAAIGQNLLQESSDRPLSIRNQPIRLRLETLAKWWTLPVFEILKDLEGFIQLGHGSDIRKELEDAIADGIIIALRDPDSSLTYTDLAPVLNWSRRFSDRVYRIIAEAVIEFEPKTELLRKVVFEMLAMRPSHRHDSVRLLAACIAVAPDGQNGSLVELEDLLSERASIEDMIYDA